jgi:hypothetical protein
MKQPIFMYYQLDDFYQNHRRYAILSLSLSLKLLSDECFTLLSVRSLLALFFPT